MLTATILGQTQPNGEGALEGAITAALRRYRMQTHPTGYWNVTPELFDKLVVYALNIANATGNGRYSAAQVAAAVTKRGYRLSTVDPRTLLPPGTLPSPPVIVPEPVPPPGMGPQPPPAPVRKIIIPVPPPTEPVMEIITDRLPGKITLPVIVPPPPAITPAVYPPVKKDYTWLWAAGLLALIFLWGKRTPYPSKSRVDRRSGPKTGSGGLSGLGGIGGATANCALWQERYGPDGGLVWRCLMYAPACDGADCALPITGEKARVRTCVKTKKVPAKSWRYKRKFVERCVKYQRICADDVCMSKPFRKPKPSPGHGLNINVMTRSLAKSMADAQNEAEETAGKALARNIMDRGGIRSYRKGREKEEYREIPLFMRKGTGLPLDEMASEMGYQTGEELMRVIAKEYPKTKRKKRRFDWKDFEQQAEGIVWNDVEAGYVSGLAALRRKPGNRLFFMWQPPGAEPKSISRAKLPGYRMAAEAGDGDLFYLWARNADDARRRIAKGEGEIANLGSIDFVTLLSTAYGASKLLKGM